jgi:16S rRNA G1207 methylase RsmC
MLSVTEEHYFAAQPTAPNVRREIQFQVWGHEYRLTAAGGVFSAGRLDPGTAVLLRKVQPPAGEIKAPILDLGCGYGPIAVALATATPALVYAVDVNERALDLVRENAKACGVGERIIATRPDEVPEDVRFSQIWSNPPIRIGKQELHAMLERWLPRLVPGGVAWLVAARNLGGDSLHSWLRERGFTVTRTASQKGYRVLQVTTVLK